ncbi:uncharacterized protein LOC124900692 [Homo sapiens]|uniref:uncharacterized protein LOC124900692 n=1 Tax=Homo sapiens TaxID=9606 RepID=UPI001FB083CD|nr:uncharacterized protein LOC124900692 [Homo sapiens]
MATATPRHSLLNTETWVLAPLSDMNQLRSSSRASLWWLWFPLLHSTPSNRVLQDLGGRALLCGMLDWTGKNASSEHAYNSSKHPAHAPPQPPCASTPMHMRTAHPKGRIREEGTQDPGSMAAYKTPGQKAKSHTSSLKLPA